jgi:hypothetical protein
VAGAVAAAFDLVLIEPFIERAIQQETQTGRPQESVAPPVVSRETQRWGLVAGLVVLGIVWGTVFGLVAFAGRSWRPPEWSAARWALSLALLTGWTVSLLPFLKYPANPPGVGEPETIGYRQGLYFGFVVLSVAGTAIAVGLSKVLRRGGERPGPYRRWIGPAAYALYAAAVFVLMPTNPDPVRLSDSLIRAFRFLSASSLILFWVVLGIVFGRVHKTEAV